MGGHGQPLRTVLPEKNNVVKGLVWSLLCWQLAPQKAGDNTAREEQAAASQMGADSPLQDPPAHSHGLLQGPLGSPMASCALRPRDQTCLAWPRAEIPPRSCAGSPIMSTHTPSYDWHQGWLSTPLGRWEL